MRKGLALRNTPVPRHSPPGTGKPVRATSWVQLADGPTPHTRSHHGAGAEEEGLRAKLGSGCRRRGCALPVRDFFAVLLARNRRGRRCPAGRRRGRAALVHGALLGHRRHEAEPRGRSAAVRRRSVPGLGTKALYSLVDSLYTYRKIAKGLTLLETPGTCHTKFLDSVTWQMAPCVRSPQARRT